MYLHLANGLFTFFEGHCWLVQTGPVLDDSYSYPLYFFLSLSLFHRRWMAELLLVTVISFNEVLLMYCPRQAKKASLLWLLTPPTLMNSFHKVSLCMKPVSCLLACF